MDKIDQPLALNQYANLKMGAYLNGSIASWSVVFSAMRSFVKGE